MMYTSALLALASTASAAVQGFNYGNVFTTGAIKQQSDYEAEFTTAQNLVGASDFTSARLYTMVVSFSEPNIVMSVERALLIIFSPLNSKAPQKMTRSRPSPPPSRQRRRCFLDCGPRAPASRMSSRL